MKKIFGVLRNLVIITLAAITFNSVPVTAEKVTSSRPDTVVNLANKKAKKKQKTKKISDKGKIIAKSKWPKATAKVYLNVKKDFEMQNATFDAMDAWNQTGAFKFKQISNKKKANITVNLMSDDDTDAAGETNITYQPKKKRIIKAKVYLNIFYLEDPIFGYSYNRVVNTVEHELGHAIGLNHNNNVSVMYPSGSYYSIQDRDVAAVKKLYHKK